MLYNKNRGVCPEVPVREDTLQCRWVVEWTNTAAEVSYFLKNSVNLSEFESFIARDKCFPFKQMFLYVTWNPHHVFFFFFYATVNAVI